MKLLMRLAWMTLATVCLGFSAPESRDAEDAVASRRYAQRLELLKPTEPEAYFHLAEEIAENVGDEGMRRLAIRLYVLAYELDRQRGGVHSLAASACLGLIPVANTDRDKLWLSGVARVLDARQGSLEWSEFDRPSEPDSVYYKAATVLGNIRAGRGDAARTLIQDPQVTAVLYRFDRTFVRLGVQGGVRGLLQEAEQWPCKECSNERIVRRGNRGQDVRLCPVCKGSPGPALKGGELLSHLRAESLLLQGSQRSWAAQLSMDGGAPLLDPDPDAVAESFGIDAKLVLFQEGKWVADPNVRAKPKDQKKVQPDPALKDQHPPQSTDDKDRRPGVAGN